VTIFALVEGDTVKTISKFSGGKRVKKGEVVVMDLQGHTLLKGMTNEEGEFSFKIPKREALKVVLKAGMGHRAEWTIPTEEVTGSPNETKDMAPEQIQNPSEGRKDSSESYALKTVASDEIEAAVEKALDRRLQPIVTMLERIHEPKTSLKDILGGIGYIVGLVGIAAYIQSVRKKPTRKGS
jgi:nickel transport protein